MAPIILASSLVAAIALNACAGLALVGGNARLQATEEPLLRLQEFAAAAVSEPQAARMYAVVGTIREEQALLRQRETWLLALASLSAAGLVGALGLALRCCQADRIMLGQLREADDAVVRSERTRMRFLEVVSHDLRQPLQTIELFSAGLQRRQSDPESAPMLDGIRSSLTTMRRMLSGLMDIGRLDSHAVAPERVDVAIDELFAPIAAEFAPLAQARGLGFSVVGGGAVAHTDPIMLECVLRNLIANAVRYTQAGTVTVRCHPAGEQLAIVVSDTGPGIAEAELGRIFQEFYRVSATAQSTEGLGLGLAIVRRMIRLLDLSLEVSSTLGEGTSFTVMLPPATGRGAGRADMTDWADMADGVACGTHAGGDDHAALALAGIRVLVVDDDAAIRAGLDRELSARGMAVTVVAGPSAACALFAAASPPGFDIALVDRDLGADLTGPQLLDHLAAKLGIAIPALVLSGTRDFKVIAELQSGDYPWLSKPVDTGVLLGEMGRLAMTREAVTLPA
jgi:signal transduction histidine kinase/ActR/RegA family two-component response regulator